MLVPSAANRFEDDHRPQGVRSRLRGHVKCDRHRVQIVREQMPVSVEKGSSISKMLCIIRIEDLSTPRSDSLSGSPKRASSRQSARSAAPTTTPWPRRLTAYTRPSWSNRESPGAPSSRSSWPPPNGSTGSTTAGSTSTAPTFHPSTLRPPTTLNTGDHLPAESPNHEVSGLTGAVHGYPERPVRHNV